MEMNTAIATDYPTLEFNEVDLQARLALAQAAIVSDEVRGGEKLQGWSCNDLAKLLRRSPESVVWMFCRTDS